MAIDPICGMSVQEEAAAGSTEYEGRRYYFCSTHCLAKFGANPAAGFADVTRHGGWMGLLGFWAGRRP